MRLDFAATRFPILGDGKGDNQNSAIPFTRGTYVQCIDANQAHPVFLRSAGMGLPCGLRAIILAAAAVVYIGMPYPALRALSLQGAYFEQMLLLPNVLGEFRSSRSGGGGRPRSSTGQ